MSSFIDNEQVDENIHEDVDMETLQYPPPPHYLYSKYTNENVALELVPLPPKPPESTYSCFGVEIDPEQPMLQPLEQQGIVSLADIDSNMDSREVMLKILDSLMYTYLKILESLSNLKPHKVIDDMLHQIETLFINLHDLINKKRIHQFYESSRNHLYNNYQKDISSVKKIEETINGICDVYKEMIDTIKNYEENIVQKTKPTIQ